MNILSFKPGHDGTVAHIGDGKLLELLEAEKDSGIRYSQLNINHFLSKKIFSIDAFALSGWSHGTDPEGRSIGLGYMGLQVPERMEQMFRGIEIPFYTSSHERSHIMCSYALSPFPQGQPCYCLVWEGYIGAFYYINSQVTITKLIDIMNSPGVRYSFAYALADKKFNLPAGTIRLGDAGKLMALAAYNNNSTATLSNEENDCLQKIFSNPNLKPHLDKSAFNKNFFLNCEIGSDRSKRLARIVSDYIYEFFLSAIKPHLTELIPLLISGGCGLNCDWNRRLSDSGLFSEIFVPPVTNDIGASIGTGVDVQFALNGNAKLNWDVYSGQPFIDDINLYETSQIHDYTAIDCTKKKIAELIKDGAIIAWISGNMEIGPRALGNRSILAAPFHNKTTDQLNHIKKRENFRPIAPICLAEDAKSLFDLNYDSPYMLFFTKVLSSKLKAITHIDGSARVQTVTESQNSAIYQLLKAFKEITGYGVLCNTSLNFHHHGFINRSSDLIKYVTENNLDGFYINGRFFIKRYKHFRC